jgi:hypothetical protein
MVNYSCLGMSVGQDRLLASATKSNRKTNTCFTLTKDSHFIPRAVGSHCKSIIMQPPPEAAMLSWELSHNRVMLQPPLLQRVSSCSVGFQAGKHLDALSDSVSGKGGRVYLWPHPLGDWKQLSRTSESSGWGRQWQDHPQALSYILTPVPVLLQDWEENTSLHGHAASSLLGHLSCFQKAEHLWKSLLETMRIFG